MKTALYARVSTDEQKEGQTIDSQITELETSARQNGWQIVEVYKDEGWSGGVMERPELDHLRDDARKGLFSAVLINDVDRLARDVTHLGVIKRDLERHGVQVIFRKLPSENSPTHNLMVNILGSFAEFERELIADRTRRGRRHKVEVRKQYLGTKPAYGYRYLPADRATGRPGRLEIVPKEATVVRKVFAWVDEEGLSARKVLVRLGELRIRPRGGAQHWGRSSVLRILRNEMYAGVWYYNKHRRSEPLRRLGARGYTRHVKSSTRRRPKTDWLPWVLPQELRLVPRGQWERVQRQLDRNITFSPRNEKHSYLLKGLVRCGRCGARYVGDPSHGRYYYRCWQRRRKCPSIMENKLNETVWDAISEAILNPDLLIEQAKRFQENESKRLRNQQSTAAEVEKDLKRLDSEESRILDAYQTALITPAQLGAQLEKLKTQRETLMVRRDEFSARTETSPNPENLASSVRDYCRAAAQRLHSFTWEERRQFLRLLIREIVFNGNSIRVRGALPIEGTKNQNRLHGTRDAKPVALSPGRTVTTSIGLRGHSPVTKDHDCSRLDFSSSFPSSFEVTKHVVQKPLPPQPRDASGRFIGKNQSFHRSTADG